MQFCGYPSFKWDLVGCLGLNELRHDKTNNPPSLISLRSALNALRTQAFFMRTVKTLIRLGGSESLLGTHSFCWFCHVAA